MAADEPGQLIAQGNHFRSKSRLYVPGANLCWRCLDLNAEEYSDVLTNEFYQLGDNSNPIDAAIFVRRNANALIESGHIKIIGNSIERVPSASKNWI